MVSDRLHQIRMRKPESLRIPFEPAGVGTHIGQGSDDKLIAIHRWTANDAWPSDRATRLATGRGVGISPRRDLGHTTRMTVTVLALPPLRLAALRHTGAYLDIGQAFAALDAIVRRSGVGGPNTMLAAVYYDDPAKTPAAALRRSILESKYSPWISRPFFWTAASRPRWRALLASMAPVVTLSMWCMPYVK